MYQLYHIYPLYYCKSGGCCCINSWIFDANLTNNSFKNTGPKCRYWDLESRCAFTIKCKRFEAKHKIMLVIPYARNVNAAIKLKCLVLLIPKLFFVFYLINYFLLLIYLCCFRHVTLLYQFLKLLLKWSFDNWYDLTYKFLQSLWRKTMNLGMSPLTLKTWLRLDEQRGRRFLCLLHIYFRDFLIRDLQIFFNCKPSNIHISKLDPLIP